MRSVLKIDLHGDNNIIDQGKGVGREVVGDIGEIVVIEMKGIIFEKT